MDRRARGLDFEPGSWDPFQQLACVGVEAVECFPLGFAWDGEAAVANQSHAWHRDQVLELGGWRLLRTITSASSGTSCSRASRASGRARAAAGSCTISA